MATVAECAAMRRAITLSAAGLGSTSPNPPVGCVVLDRDGAVAGEGFHLRKGESHAEVHALAAAGRQARGGAAVVTLEPCNHFGRTPPCHQALIIAGVARVVVALLDPTSRGEGGVARLRAAGVEVEVGVLEAEAGLVLGGWLTAQQRKRPVVTWGYAVTAAGRQSLLAAGAPRRGFLSRFDVVVSEDRTVREAVAGAHGVGMLNLPVGPLPEDPHSALDDLFQAGARSVLLDVGSSWAQVFLEQALVDVVIAYFGVDGPSRNAGLPQPDLLPAGFRIDGVTPVAGGVEIDATPDPELFLDVTG